jgi:hypothetical protein
LLFKLCTGFSCEPVAPSSPLALTNTPQLVSTAVFESSPGTQMIGVPLVPVVAMPELVELPPPIPVDVADSLLPEQAKSNAPSRAGAGRRISTLT